jgi:thiamine-monophosphate kinase
MTTGMTPDGPTIGDLGEHAIVARVRTRVPPSPGWVHVGIGDDAAVIGGARNRVDVVTTDAFVEGVHFDRSYVPPHAIGHKALAVNLSDLAAMGAEPAAALMSLVLPPTLPVAVLDGILDGWMALAARHDVALIGGNVSRSPGPLLIDVTAIGRVKPRRVLQRKGARPGDAVYLSGALGAAHAGWLACRLGPAGDEARASAPECVARFLTPEPRLRLGMLLSRSGVVTSCMDLSDGLGDAIRQVTSASGVGALIERDALPIPSEARALFEQASLDPVAAAIAGGEDYELLFTAPARRRRALDAALKRCGVSCTRIGTVTSARELILRAGGSRGPLPEGFVHFR